MESGVDTKYKVKMLINFIFIYSSDLYKLLENKWIKNIVYVINFTLLIKQWTVKWIRVKIFLNNNFVWDFFFFH